MVLTDQQALRVAFTRKDIHGHLAGWLDFLAEYDFEIQYCSKNDNQAADFLSRVQHGEPAAVYVDKGDIVVVMMTQDAAEMAVSQLEPSFHDFVRHLAGISLGDKSSLEKARTRHVFICYVWWEGHLYRRRKTGVVVAAPTMEREKVMQSLHDELVIRTG